MVLLQPLFSWTWAFLDPQALAQEHVTQGTHVSTIHRFVFRKMLQPHFSYEKIAILYKNEAEMMHSKVKCNLLTKNFRLL